MDRKMQYNIVMLIIFCNIETEVSIKMIKLSDCLS